MKMLFSLDRSYSKVPAEDLNKDIDSYPSVSWRRTRLVILAVCCFIAGAVSVEVVETFKSHLGHPPRTLELQTFQHSFKYNRSFSEAPSPHTDRSWREIFPLEGGFFVNEQIAPKRSTFSTFHQLHCLDNIRKSYWINHNAALNGTKLTDDDIHIDVRPSHVRHCIDLLRQSLMCQADTTLEVVDEAINGVHGFRVVHTCKDWDQLVKWTSQQQLKRHVEQIV